MDHHEWRAGQETVRVVSGDHAFDVAYREVGAGAPATLFLHGVSGWGFVFRNVCGAVGHALLPDMPGHGYTRHVGPGGYDRSLRAEEEYLVDLLDELGLETVQVVGHDIGGGIALRLAVNTDRVERLVLANAASADSWPVERMLEFAQPARARNLTYKDVTGMLREKFSTSTYDPGQATEEFVEGMVAPYLDPDRPVTDFSRNAISLNTNHTLELEPFLDRIDAPTLLLWGVPGSGQHAGYARRLAEAIPDTQVVFLERSDHWVMQDRPTAFREGLARFLD